MKPANFQYFAPTTIDEALALLAEHGDAAKVLAGGQSLTPMMNFRLVTPAILVDLNRIVELAYIRERDGGVAIGAMTRQRAVERNALIAQRAPLVAETLPFVAHPQIRNRGTFGGSLAHADPAAELPAVAIALNAKFKVKSQKRERWADASDFFTGLFSTVLAPEELLTEIILPPLPARAGYAFQEVSRRHGDFALAGVACALTLDSKGACADARIVLLGLGVQPIDARGAAKQIIGAKPNADAIRAVAEAVDAEIDPGSDIHASAEYRRHLAKVLTRRALEKAVERVRD
ncbi:MAG: xanthine dehydrogenase family protein subunit M [Chloroflexota bacterium]|nr:xanthine dehydrogenase family protein subunit M [Chloroflexota bacterium]